jgi:hypothetical protein
MKEQLFSSRLINYSEYGVLIELNLQLRAGDAIALYFSPEIQKEEKMFSEACVGMVRWCSEQDGVYSGFYSAGVELAVQ